MFLISFLSVVLVVSEQCEQVSGLAYTLPLACTQLAPLGEGSGPVQLEIRSSDEARNPHKCDTHITARRDRLFCSNPKLLATCTFEKGARPKSTSICN